MPSVVIPIPYWVVNAYRRHTLDEFCWCIDERYRHYPWTHCKMMEFFEDDITKLYEVVAYADD